MFGFKRKTSQDTQTATTREKSSKGFFGRLKSGLAKTGSTLTSGMGGLVLGKKAIDDELFEELENRLLMADVGIEATTRIIDALTDRVKRKRLDDAGHLYQALGEIMVEILEPASRPLDVDIDEKPFVILVVGINGAGKTTSIGKLAHHFQNEGRSVMLAAGDTFRAAAVEQLQVWGERNNVPVVSQGTGADSASVIFDALQSARARNMDILIADTAGRLHTQDNLMEELKKIKRVLGKIDADAPHETLLVVDGGTGQNALRQAEAFNEAIGLTGLAITKLDGTAKGGIVFALAEKVGLPIRFIGVGEKLEDLRPFDAGQFVEALLATDA
ncbi:MAG TPA: signal recognition particle-docking protein FtsY [Rhodobacteraceae bacterium]|nr:signal recognition particle-docking protein FtsY [Paracoccaceae bacterium]